MAVVVLSGMHASVRGMHSTLVAVQYGARSVGNRREALNDEQRAIFDALVESINEATMLADELANAIPALVPAEHE